MTTTGFIGLGVMGRPMAANLPRAGYGVVGYGRRAEPSRSRSSPGQASAARERRCGHRRVRCPDHHAAGFARRRGGGARRAGRSRARSARSAADRHEHHPAAERDGHRRGGTGVGVRTLDAPVSGGEADAINATLPAMVGGAAEDFAVALPVLGTMGKIVAHVGGSGGAAGQGR
jgi:2-hydroxy-3-oxopropionate reductase